MAALETAQAWAAADHAAAERVLQDQLDAANVREKNLTEKKLQLETALRAAMIEADELRRALARQAAPSDAVNQSSTRAVDIPANNNTNTTINTVTTSSTSNTIQAPVDETSLHEKCEAQRAVLVHTIAAQEDQIAMWGQRHAITVAEYEETIANLSARAVGVALALDTARDSQSRSARLGLVGTQVALDELQAKLTREHAEDLTALRASERAALEARDAAQAELARVKDDMAAEKARTAAERDATVARLEQEVRRLQTALDTGASQWHGDVTTMRSAFEADVRSRDMVVGQEKARLESQLARTEEHYRSQLQAAEREAAAVAARHNAQLADVRQLHRTEMAALEQRLRAAEDRGKAQARAQDEALQRARESFEERLREVTQRHRSEAAVLAEQHQSVRTQLEQAQAQHSRQIAGVSATATSETATRQALQRENDQYQSALGVAQQRIAALESALRDEKEARRRESEQLRATNEHLQDELYAAQGDREGLEAELQQLRAHFAQLEDSIHRLSEREQRLDEEHTEAMRRLAEQERAFQDKIRALQARSETRSDSAILAPLAVPVFTSNHVTNSSTNSSSVLNHSTSSGTVTSESTRNLSFHAATGASRADTGLDHLRGPFVQHHGASSLWSSTVKH